MPIFRCASVPFSCFRDKPPAWPFRSTSSLIAVLPCALEPLSAPIRLAKPPLVCAGTSLRTHQPHKTSSRVHIVIWTSRIEPKQEEWENYCYLCFYRETHITHETHNTTTFINLNIWVHRDCRKQLLWITIKPLFLLNDSWIWIFIRRTHCRQVDTHRQSRFCTHIILYQIHTDQHNIFRQHGSRTVFRGKVVLQHCQTSRAR